MGKPWLKLERTWASEKENGHQSGEGEGGHGGRDVV